MNVQLILLKWLDNANRYILLECFNNVLQRDIWPESFKLASVVPVYRKRDATQMESYRPMLKRLLQTLDKIFAAGLIKKPF